MPTLCWRPLQGFGPASYQRCGDASHGRSPACRSAVGDIGEPVRMLQRVWAHLPWRLPCHHCMCVYSAHLPSLCQALCSCFPQLDTAWPLPQHALNRYYSTRGEGKQYRRYCRRLITDPFAAPTEHDSMDLMQPEEVLLDQDAMAGALSWRCGTCAAPVLSGA